MTLHRFHHFSLRHTSVTPRSKLTCGANTIDGGADAKGSLTTVATYLNEHLVQHVATRLALSALRLLTVRNSKEALHYLLLRVR